MSPSIEHLNIICYKWGPLYGPEYVNKVASMVRRNLSVPHRFHCITDNHAGLSPEIEIHALPELGIDGIWRKLMTFQDNFLGLQGQYVVSIDIDVVVVGSLDFLAEDPDKEFIIARNWVKGGTRGSGSLYRLKVGSQVHVWEDFIKHKESVIDRFHGKTRLIGEQNWLNANFETFDHFPEGKVVSFKRHCGARGRIFRLKCFELLNTARFGKARPPRGAALVSFHGEPSPEEVMDGPCGRWRHAPFVREHWQSS